MGLRSVSLPWKDRSRPEDDEGVVRMAPSLSASPLDGQDHSIGARNPLTSGAPGDHANLSGQLLLQPTIR
jgi:hypothetical protein